VQRSLPADARPLTRVVALGWGLGGVLAILVVGLVRLAARAAEAFEHPLGAAHHAFAVGWLAFMLYTEGYRGFQLRFAPTCAARAWHLAASPRPAHLAAAPLFCMGFFHATRARKVRSWGLTIGIVLVVIAVHHLPQPWRGLVDLGVIGGLTYGALALLAAALRGPGVADPQLPG
jgi:hypothetical protein